MVKSDSKMRACELRFKKFASWKLPAEQFSSQYIFKLWIIVGCEVCILFHVHKCDKVNLFWRCCSVVDDKYWKFLMFLLQYGFFILQVKYSRLLYLSLLRLVPASFLQEKLWNYNLKCSFTNVRNIAEIFNSEKSA